MAGGRDIAIIERLFKSKLGARTRQFLIFDKKIIAKRWKSVVLAELDRLAVDLSKVLLLAGPLAEQALALRAKLRTRFNWLDKFSEQAFAEVYATVLNRGHHVDVVVRGLVVERFIPDMLEMETLLKQMTKLAKESGKKWGAPKLMSGLRTPNGRQIADWVVCSVNQDGRVWIMALVESKSISNMENLIGQEGRGVGQFLWDHLRAKGEGLIIDAVDAQGNVSVRSFAAADVLLEPVMRGVGKTPRFPTRFIGVIPEKFSKRAALNKNSAGLLIDEWTWPVSQAEVLKLIRKIEDSLAR